MKRVAAIVLSLMFVWLQVGSSAQFARTVAKVCRCCDCNQTDCCVSAASPDTQLPLSLPVTGNLASDFSLSAPSLVTWTMPVKSSPISAFDSAPLPALAVPLFTRHCALLI